jgi:hypothetical protein
MSGTLNQPYTVVKKTTTVQKLADGTTLTRITNTTEVRDSQGRSMQKHDLISTGAAEGQTHPYSVIVMDPVAHTTTHWMVPGKEATVMHGPLMNAPVVRPAPPSSLAASAPPVSAVGTAVLLSGVSIPPSAAFGSNHPRPESKREKLDGKVINGIYAEGTRITTTFPVGFFGSDRPIVQINESWVSPDLKLMIAGTNEDPRSGTTTIELISLDRGEPDPALFTPPQGYEIKEQGR